MGNQRSFKIEYVQRVGDPESKRLKVAALNLLEASHFSLTGRFLASRPKSLTASPLFPKALFLILQHSLSRGEGQGGGDEIGRVQV
jgi:hypothetical protein